MNKQIRVHLFILTGFAVVLGLMILFQVISGTTSNKGSSKGGTAGVETGHELVDAKDKAAAAKDLGRRRNPESVPYLVAYLKDPDPKVRAAVAEALGTIGSKVASIDLVMRLENEPDAGTRAAILWALGQLEKTDTIPKVVRRVDDDSPQVRLAAIEALTHWSTANAILGIAHGTSDTNAAVRNDAAARLLKIGETAIQPMLDVMDEGRDPSRVLRIETISRIDSQQAVPALLEVLRQHCTSFPLPQTPVIESLVSALVSKGDSAATALLPIVSEPGNLPLKSAAATTLARLKSAAAVDAARDRLLSWTAMSSRQEWRLWMDMVKAVDTPSARDALTRLNAHYRTIAGRLPEAPPMPKRDPIPPRKATDPSGYTGELSLFLQKPDDGRKGLRLDLQLIADAGAWDRVWGCNSINRGIHEGLVMDVTVKPGTFDFHIGMLVGDDPWVKGGFADLHIKLARPAGGNGPIRGTYEGSYKGTPIAGPVTGDEHPRRPIVVKDFVPLHPDEHPRLLFRQADLATIRKRAGTPFGESYQEACSTSADPLNHAMLYQITGDRNFAESSMKLVEAYGEEIEAMEGSGSGGFGHRLVRVALCYDLCYDAWPEAFKQRIRDRLRISLPALQNYIAINGGNYHPCCNYYGPGRGAPAIAALAMWGEKGPKPAPPPDPFSNPTVIPPADDYKPSGDTPVVELTPTRFPGRWMIAGPAPFPLAPMAADMLLKINPLRPHPGYARKAMGLVTETVGTNDVTTMVESTFAFVNLPPEMLQNDAVDFTSRRLPDGDSTFLLSTVLEVKKEQTVAILSDGASGVWINGVRADTEGCCLLRPGLYPMTAVCTMSGNRNRAAPRPVAPDSPEMKASNAEHTFRMALWKADCEDWERYGGADTFWQRCVNKGFWHMYAHYRVGIGDGGFQAETGSYADIASWFPLVYAGMSTRLFGRSPSPYPDVTHLVPRRMMQVYFPADGRAPFAQKINSCHGLRAEHCAAIMPALPERFRDPVLWGWNRVTSGNGEGNLATNTGSEAADLWGSSLGSALHFINYPLDGYPVRAEPVEPAKSMPLTWEAKTFGYYCFRSGWQGKDEFIAQVFLKAFPIGGWNDPNAGAFRLFGLGKEWVTGNQGKAGIRQNEPVVVLLPEWVEGSGTDVKKMKADKKAVAMGLLLEDKNKAKPVQPKAVFNHNALGHLLYSQFEPDGSGVLSVDYKDVYSAAQKDVKVPRVTGMRSIGFDYSGTGGAPCLLAIADKVEGDVDKVWLWPLPARCLSNTVVKDNTFVVRQGDCTMTGTFLSPANVKIEATSENIVHLGARLFDKELDRIKATGDSSFLVVITIQRGDAPPVHVSGSGMDAHATVGNRIVRFDGEKIIFAPK